MKNGKEDKEYHTTAVVIYDNIYKYCWSFYDDNQYWDININNK